MDNILRDLERLQKLREAGVLTDGEFDEQKASIMSSASISEADSELAGDEPVQAHDTLVQPGSFSTIDISTIGVFVAALALFVIIGPASFLFAVKFSVILAIIIAIVIYVDARHIDLQGYDWNRAKWGFTTAALSIITIPIYIYKRENFIEDIGHKYGENLSILIKKPYLILMYLLFCLVLIYQVYLSLSIGSSNSSEIIFNSTDSSAESSENLVPAEPVGSKISGEYSQSERKLIDNWAEANEMCRGSSEPEQWCSRRDAALEDMNRAEICYGHDDDPSAVEYVIHRCRAGSFNNFKRDTAVNSNATQYAVNTTWDCSSVYGEQVFVKFEMSNYTFSPRNPDNGQTSGTLVQGETEMTAGTDETRTELNLLGSNSGEWALIGGSEGIALFHFSELSGDGSECTLPGQAAKYSTN